MVNQKFVLSCLSCSCHPGQVAATPKVKRTAGATTILHLGTSYQWKTNWKQARLVSLESGICLILGLFCWMHISLNNFQPDIENLPLFFNLIDFFPVSLPVSLQRQLAAVWSKKSQIQDKEEPGLYSPKPLTSSKWTPAIQIVHSNVNTSP